MGIARSPYYAETAAKAADAEIIDEMKAICDEFEAYGYRRVDAELRHRGHVVNSKKVRRLMREHDLTRFCCFKICPEGLQLVRASLKA